jgi:hypothetical protein
LKPFSFIGFLTAAVFNPWVVNHFIPAQNFAETQFWAVAGLDAVLVIWSLFTLKRIHISTFQNLLLSTSITIWFVFGISILDHKIGPRILEHKKNLVYGAFDRAHMVSTEFELTYIMNNLGFRGPHTKIEKDQRERIAFIGDSFTFGWGVEEKDSWVGILRNNHPESEILNLGRGGEHPMDYVQQARKILPILKPDRLVICLLAWNDLFQMKRVMDYERGATIKTFEDDSPQPKISFPFRVYRRLFPNLSSVFTTVSNMPGRWESESRWIKSQLDQEGLDRYDSLSEEVKSAFEQFKLNPWILNEGLFHRQSYSEACSGKMDEALVRISHHLIELEELAKKYDCDLEFILLPYRPSNCPECLSDLSGLGYQISVDNPCLVDSIIERPLSGMISTPIHFFDSWQHQPESVHGWYFPLDGHLNENGNSVVAQWADTVLFR